MKIYPRAAKQVTLGQPICERLSAIGPDPFPPEYGGPGVPVGLPHVGQDGLRVCDAPGGVPVRQEEYHGLNSLLKDSLLLDMRHNGERFHCTQSMRVIFGTDQSQQSYSFVIKDHLENHNCFFVFILLQISLVRCNL
jgi:hypothetical protein